MDRDDRTMAFAPVRDESCGEILLRVYDAFKDQSDMTPSISWSVT